MGFVLILETVWPVNENVEKDQILSLRMRIPNVQDFKFKERFLENCWGTIYSKTWDGQFLCFAAFNSRPYRLVHSAIHFRPLNIFSGYGQTLSLFSLVDIKLCYPIPWSYLQNRFLLRNKRRPVVISGQEQVTTKPTLFNKTSSFN